VACCGCPVAIGCARASSGAIAFCVASGNSVLQKSANPASMAAFVALGTYCPNAVEKRTPLSRRPFLQAFASEDSAAGTLEPPKTVQLPTR